MPTQYRCRNNDCRFWYQKDLGECPACGTQPHKFNSWLRRAGLDAHLHTTANAGQGESYRAAHRAAKDLLT